MSQFGLLTAAWQVLNLLILIGWLALTVVALVTLGSRQLAPMIEWLWTALVILVPILGSLAFFIVAPGKTDT